MMRGFEFFMFGRVIACFAFVVFLILIVLLIVFLVKAARRGHLHGEAGVYPQNFKPNVKALEILSERYAKGEMDDEEYKRRKEELNKV
jgi:putative membrane protein